MLLNYKPTWSEWFYVFAPLQIYLIIVGLLVIYGEHYEEKNFVKQFFDAFRAIGTAPKSAECIRVSVVHDPIVRVHDLARLLEVRRVAPRLARDPVRWAQNVASMRASNANFELMTTFNEWGEGTAVESATEWSTTSGQGTYLDLLHASLFANQ